MTDKTELALNALSMEVSKNVKKGDVTERELVGTVTLYSPTLKDIGIEAEHTGRKDDGALVYADQTQQWVYNAILAAVKANARNRLQSGSTALRAGAKLPENLLELVTPSENTSTVLADRRALFDYFKGHLAGIDKPENVKKLLLTFLEKPEMLALQPEAKRAQIKPYFEAFGEAVFERLNEWQVNYLQGVLEQCDATEVEF